MVLGHGNPREQAVEMTELIDKTSFVTPSRCISGLKNFIISRAI